MSENKKYKNKNKKDIKMLIKWLLRSTLQHWIKTNYENYNFIMHTSIFVLAVFELQVYEKSTPTQLLVTKGYFYTRAELSSEITYEKMNYVGEKNIKIIKWWVTYGKNSFSKQFNCIMMGYYNLPDWSRQWRNQDLYLGVAVYKKNWKNQFHFWK